MMRLATRKSPRLRRTISAWAGSSSTSRMVTGFPLIIIVSPMFYSAVWRAVFRDAGRQGCRRLPQAGCLPLPGAACWLTSSLGVGVASLQFREIFPGALRAVAVRESGVGVLLDLALHLAPVALVVADFLAGGADGQQAAQGLDLRQGLLQLGNQLLLRRHGLPAFGEQLPLAQGALHRAWHRRKGFRGLDDVIQRARLDCLHRHLLVAVARH